MIDGDGSWRFVQAVPAGPGEVAVPTYDGATAFVFDASGRHLRTVDGHLGLTQLTFAYDATGRLTGVQGSSGGQPVGLSVKRATDGTLQALTGIDGAITSVTLDPKGEIAGLVNPAGASTLFTWAAGGLLASETDALGGTTHDTYDSGGLLVSSTDADGVTTQLTRTISASGLEIKAVSPQGRTTTHRTESVSGGIRRTSIAPDGSTTIETTAADGSRAVSLPDGTSRTIGAAPSASWGLAAPIQTPDVETRADGVTSRTVTTQDLAATGGRPYALGGSVTTTVNGQAWTERYDPSGRSTKLVDPVGRQTIQVFDDADRLASSTAPGTAAASYTYDSHGREATFTLGTGQLAETTRFTFDASTGTVITTRPDGTSEKTVFDSAGNATRTTAPDGSTGVASYDADGRPTQLQPAGGLSFTLGSSPTGRSTAFLPPAVGSDASIETTTYDSDGNPVAVSGLGTRAMTATYDSAGQVTGWTFDQGKSSATYNPSSGLLAGAMDPGGETTTYGYAGSTPDKLAWSGPVTGSVAAEIDANGRVASEAVDSAPPIPLTYDGSGALTGVGSLSYARDATTGLATHATLGAVATVEQYDSNNRLSLATTTASGKVVLVLKYSRDALGRITGLTETAANGSTTTTTYTYDGADRLAQVTVNGKTIEADTYDAAGNRTAVASPNGTTKATYDARDRLVSWGAAAYAWAADGNLTRISRGAAATSFTFDDLGRLRGATLPNAEAITYVVDADGRRVGREVAGKLVAGYLYDPAGRVVGETDGNGAVIAQFGYDDLGHLALVERNGSSDDVITDQVGSPRLVIDSQSGSIVDAITYDAWGRIVSETTPGTIPFGFAGGLLDPGTGLIHFGARDYDPPTGRWTGSDPIRFAANDLNLYRYVGGDPVDHTDSRGLLSGCGWGEIGLGFSSFLLGGQWAVLLGFKLLDKYPCNPDDPPDPPAPPGSGGGSGKGFSCSGLICSGPNGWCVGTASNPCSIGDTHLYTADGAHADFQAAGEFIASTSPEGNPEIQARQEPWAAGSSISFNTAVAANVAGDRVGVYAKEPSFLLVNGVAVTQPDLAERLPHGGSVERHGALVTVIWPDGGRMIVNRIAQTLDYTYTPASGVGPTLHGLLGSADGNSANDLTSRDGVVLDRSDPAFQAKLYSQFGKSWRITQAESLFNYQPGESTATFTQLDYPRTTVTAASLAPAVRASAEAVCRAIGVRVEPVLDDCILDVGVTGDAAFAAAEAAVAAAGTPPVATPASGPTVPLVLGQAVTGTIGAASERNDYAFTAAAGDVIYLRAGGSCIPGLQWSLLRPDGSGQGLDLTCHDLGRIVLGTAGSWTVRVSSDGTGTGAYGFTALAVPPKVSAALNLDQPVSGSISQIGAWYEYTLDAAPGQILYLDGQGTCVSGLDWELLQPGGGASGFDLTCNDLGRIVLAQPGTWTVRAYSEGTSTGAFTFTARTVPPPVRSSLVLGAPTTGSISTIGQWYEYTFAATAGEVVTLQGQGACVADLSWALVQPSGGIQAASLTCDSIGREVLATAGSWTVRVYSDKGATGAFSILVRSGS